MPVDEIAHVTDWIETQLPQLCPAWLPSQRWYGGKARTIERVAVADTVWIGPSPQRCAVVLIDVVYAGERGRAGVERYAMVIGISDTAGPSAIGRLSHPPGRYVVEAACDPAAVLDLLVTMASSEGARGTRSGGTVRGHDVSQQTSRIIAEAADGRTEVRALGLEQSNTSVRVGRAHAFKLIRRIHAGEHPQLEIERFLTAAGFPSAPSLEGSLSYQLGSDCYAIAALEGWVDNAGDGWSYVVAALQHAATDAAALERDLFTLGATTAEFHATLAAGGGAAFAPEPATEADFREWRERVTADGERLFTLIDQHHAQWPAAVAAIGRSLADARQQLSARVSGLGRGAGPVRKIRVHGDFHLGQTLKTERGFTIIDFEGEPVKPLEERRRKHCALKDVAGMLRSLDYAVATARATDARRMAMRRAFLDGYYSEPRIAGILPGRVDSGGLLELFELEKALYEVDYELNNRPNWLEIPLRAVGRLVGVGA